MEDNIIKKIVSEKRACVFISPHLDDAVLSAGGLIKYLSDKTEVEVITVFTEVSKPETLSARSCTFKAGYSDSEKFFSDRRKEDKEVLGSLGVKVSHLGFTDATWRKLDSVSLFKKYLGRIMPEFLHRYPIHQFHIISGKIHKEDNRMCDRIKKDINKILKDYKDYVVFCPFGIGSHVDHVVVKKICKEMFPDAILWSDFPYNLSLKDENKYIEGYKTLMWKKDLEEKITLISKYKTQVEAMFLGGNIPLIPEVYYVPDKNI